MRELKFRVWCKRTQEYHTPLDEEDYDEYGANLWLQMCIDTNGRLYFIETTDEDADFEYITHDCEIIDDKDTKNFIVEQYTGLKDKNGREIYEGDIVKFKSGALEQAVYHECYFGMLPSDKERPYCVPQSYYDTFEAEVIGNIHENQDLLDDTNVINKEEE